MPLAKLKSVAYQPRQANRRPIFNTNRTNRPKFHWPKFPKLPRFGGRRGRSGRSNLDFKNILLKLTGLVAIGLMLALVVGAGTIAWFGRNLPDPQNLQLRTAAASTKIYDRTGEHLLYEIAGDQKRTPVKLADLPAYVGQATLTAEDRDFYNHRGFDLRGIARAVIINLRQLDWIQGASTITQQLVKNAIVGDEVALTRKVRELILSYRIEQRFSKDEILEMYLNTIPYGSTAYGIEAASQLYFKKSAKDLSLGQATLIAALIKSPSALSPYGSNTDRLKERQQYLLQEMANLGYVSQADADAAKTEDLAISPFKDRIIAPHFVLYIKELLAEKYGERMIETGGLKITTTLDLPMQKIAEEEVEAGAIRNEEKYGGSNAAMIALDPKTGQILAMVGSRDYFDEKYDGNVNVVLRPRQPGSSFKPIAYAAAFLRGYTPDTVLYDVETHFKTDTTDYVPHNYDGTVHGPITLRQALAGSLNIPAVKTLYLAGINNVLDLAQRLGYTTLQDRSRFGLSLVLGGGEVLLMEHAAAFQAFANNGVYHTPVPILKVEDGQGQVLEAFDDQPETVLPTNVARQVTSILSDNPSRAYIFGANSPLQLGNRPVGAKTGTTNDWHDGWTIGFTPSLVAGVWAGNNNNDAMNRGADGVLVAAPIWNKFMKRALEGKPVESFTPPDPVTPANPALVGPRPGTQTVIIDKASGKLATELTPPSYREERTFRELHEILHYVDRSNPTGPAPVDPTVDPNYASWEEGVRAWAEKNGEVVGGEIAPTESDDVHTIENQPTLSLNSPTANETVRGQTIDISVVASAPRGLRGIRISLDGSLQTTIEASATISLPMTGASTGFHTLKVEAYDDIDNITTIERTFNYIP